MRCKWLKSNIYLIIVISIVCRIVLRHNNVITTLLRLLSIQPEQSNNPKHVDSLQHNLDSGGTFSLSQDTSSILTKTLGKLPWFLLVERLNA